VNQEGRTRRDFVKTVGLSVAATGMSSSISLGEEQAVDVPNVVLILVDDLGYGDLACCGARDMKTPNIDLLMSSGMRFDRFYANCPVCSPTRAALLTGRYPDLVGVPGVIRTHPNNSWGYLSADAVLIPDLLSRAGYHTALVGKWHLGLESPNTPNERGFDHFHGFLGDMMDDYYTHRRHNINYMRLNESEIDPEGHATDLFSRWSVEYIRDRARSGQPFFLYLAYNAPHTPIQPPEEWVARVMKREPGIDTRRAKLIALIEHMDDGIGNVMAALAESGVERNTLVIFTSDNGGQVGVGACNGPLRGGKQDMYEGGICVPMCAVWPGKIAADTCSDRVALSMDVFPTICEACRTRVEHEIDGVSILPALLGEHQPVQDRLLVWMRREGGSRYGGQPYYAVRSGDYKLVQNSPFEPPELYDLGNDPQEETPLGKERKEYRKLFAAMQNHIIRSGTVPWRR